MHVCGCSCQLSCKYSACVCACRYLHAVFHSLCSHLRDAGFYWADLLFLPAQSSLCDAWLLALQVGAVVVGFDKNINYYKIQYACLCIRENPGCLFIATNLDAVTHLTDAQEWAGNGAMVGAIKGMLMLRLTLLIEMLI